jgi:hypothetical protein
MTSGLDALMHGYVAPEVLRRPDRPLTRLVTCPPARDAGSSEVRHLVAGGPGGQVVGPEQPGIPGEVRLRRDTPLEALAMNLIVSSNPVTCSTEDAPARWLLDALWVVLASGEYSVIEQYMPVGSGQFRTSAVRGRGVTSVFACSPRPFRGRNPIRPTSTSRGRLVKNAEGARHDGSELARQPH